MFGWIPRRDSSGLEELGNWDLQINTIDIMYKKITNENLVYSTGVST